MFQVAQQKPTGVTLTNGFLPTTSPDHPPIFSESNTKQALEGNWTKDGFFNKGLDLEVEYLKGPRDPVLWKDWNSDSADLSKNVITHGFNSWDLERASLRPYKDQMFPRRIFDETTKEVL
jgi:hypothetical protein